MTENTVTIAGHDVTGALRLIAKGIATGAEVPGPDGTTIKLRAAPGVNAVVKQLRRDNPELNNSEARDVASALQECGFHHPTVAAFRLNELFVDGDNCPVCDTDWNSKLQKNLQMESQVTPQALNIYLGDNAHAAENLLGRPLLVKCRLCGLRLRVIHFVQAMVPAENGDGADVTLVVLNGFIPVVPRQLVTKMEALWRQTGGVAALYRMRTSEMFEQWARDEPEEAAKWSGANLETKPTILNASGQPVG